MRDESGSTVRLKWGAVEARSEAHLSKKRKKSSQEDGVQGAKIVDKFFPCSGH